MMMTMMILQDNDIDPRITPDATAIIVAVIIIKGITGDIEWMKHLLIREVSIEMQRDG